MLKTLHILNGISSITIFNQSGIDGEAIVWNEILSEGPTLEEIASPEHRELRKSFTEDQFPGHDYEEIVWGIWDLLASGESYDEIVCWYEYDLFCQINFMAMIHWLSKYRPDDRISIICAGMDDSGILKGLGEYTYKDYPRLFRERQPLNSSQKKQASKVWVTYCSTAHDELVALAKETDLPYLKQAIKAHCRRFQWTSDQLSEHQRQILSWVTEGVDSKHKLVGKCLRNNGFYGFGDLQYFNIINDLHPCIDWEKKGLTEYGEAVLKGEGDISKLLPKSYGGTSSKEFRYDPIKEKLIKWPQ